MALENKIMGVESGGDRFAKNPRSSAYGPGQFIESTWLDMIQRHRPDLMQGRSRAEVLELRSDDKIAPEMTRLYGEENARSLKAKGFEPTEGNTYLAHFAGPQGATALLSNPQARAAEVLTPAAVQANPFLKDWSAQQVIDWANRKMGFQPMTVNSDEKQTQPMGATGKEAVPMDFASILMSLMGSGAGAGAGAAAMDAAAMVPGAGGASGGFLGDFMTAMKGGGTVGGSAATAAGFPETGSSLDSLFGGGEETQGSKKSAPSLSAVAGAMPTAPQMGASPLIRASQAPKVDMARLNSIMQKRAALGL